MPDSPSPDRSVLVYEALTRLNARRGAGFGRRPLRSEEVDALEAHVGSSIPRFFRAYLTLFGPSHGLLPFPAGVQWELDSAALRRVSAATRDHSSVHALPFAHDGVGNYWVVTCAGNTGFWDHEQPGAVTPDGDFIKWLEGAVDIACKSGGAQQRAVQFCLDGLRDRDHAEAVLTTAGVERKGQWAERSRSDEEVFPGGGAPPALMKFLRIRDGAGDEQQVEGRLAGGVVTVALRRRRGVWDVVIDARETVSESSALDQAAQVLKRLACEQGWKFTRVDYGFFD